VVALKHSEGIKATTSGFSHQQLVSEPRSSENRSVLGDIRIFKVVQNKFWSYHRVELIHTNSLAQESDWSETEVSHTRHLKILFAQSQPRAPEVEDEWRPRAPYIEPFKPSRADPQAKPPAAPKNIPKNIPFSSLAAKPSRY